jgi:hypothetical protein
MQAAGMASRRRGGTAVFADMIADMIAGALRRALRGVALIVALAAASAAAAGDLTGGYFGIGESQGMRVVIEQGRAEADPLGAFIDSNGVEASFGGGWVDGAIEAVLAFPKRAVFIRVTEAPMGLVLLALPIGDDAKPIAAQSRHMVFVRDGTGAPILPPLYQPEPERADRVVDPDVFLASYAFWSPDGVSRGFGAIGARYRTMIRLHPMAHADILWALCRAEGRLASTQRGEALRGQGADCDAILSAVERLQRTGRFDDWKSAARAEADDLMAAVQCARGYIVKESVCGPASRRTAAAAVSMGTVGGVLARFD